MPRPAILFSGSLDAPISSTPSAPSASSDSGSGLASQGWSAGGGGSREIMNGISNTPYSDISIAPVHESYLTRYLLYGAIAVVGLLVIKRL